MVKTGDRVRVADNENTRMMHEAMTEYGSHESLESQPAGARADRG